MEEEEDVSRCSRTERNTIEPGFSPEGGVGRRIEVDAVAGHLLTEGQDQGYEVHWTHRDRHRDQQSKPQTTVILRGQDGGGGPTHRRKPEQQGPG